MDVMSDKSVSVIIPAHNAESCLATCIDSVLSQDLKPTQVIVINDGSRDFTNKVAMSYGDKIVYFEQQNKGQGAARNAGLKVANGRFVAFLDADDYWLPSFLRKCVSFLLEHENTIAVSTGLIIKKWGKRSVLPRILTARSKTDDAFVLQSFFDFWAEQDHVRTGSVVIRRDIIEKAGYQLSDLRISQDLEYWGYLGTYGKWGFIPEPLWGGDSTSSGSTYGWRAKYGQRRQMCPTVKQWQRRIVPRLRQEDWPGFEIVRGRVAKNFAHAKILAGNNSAARSIVSGFGRQFPKDKISKVMQFGASTGILGWKSCCYLLRLRELLKNFLISTTRSK